ncbi:MAG TPA: hypothetical protein VGD77_13600 [Gemmatimonadaceae bacterium]
MRRVRTTWMVALALGCAIAGARPAGAQVGGLLRRAKQKAADKVAERVADKASDKAAEAARGTDSTARPPRDSAVARGGGNLRRAKPLDPTVLESPGRAPGVQGQQPEWHGSAMSADAFKSSIPELTEARLAAYVRARSAMTDEALRMQVLIESPNGARAIRPYMGPTLARDELPPIPGYMKLWPMAGPRRIERHLDAVLEQALGGAMTRMQFYQLHEMVEMFVTGQVNVPGMSTGVQGRRLSGAEIALLQEHRAAFDALREKQRKLR